MCEENTCMSMLLEMLLLGHFAISFECFTDWDFTEISQQEAKQILNVQDVDPELIQKVNLCYQI